MVLDDKQKERVLAKFKENWPEPRNCYICKSNVWILQERIYELHEFSEEKFDPSKPVIPAILAICGNCGNILSFSAVRMGLSEIIKKESAE